MQLFDNPTEWQAFRKTLASNISLGFVPTMGNLHVGHLSLFKISCDANDRTVVSLFVNPTQFNNSDDFQNYPRTIEEDLLMLAQSGVDYCFLPKNQDMYGPLDSLRIQDIHPEPIMEESKRPGHFDGVRTIVMKLFNLIKPHYAYFGEKDYQQLQNIRNMVAYLFMDIEIVGCPIIREPSLLPFSSRNNRLSTEQRMLANQFAQIFHRSNASCQQIANDLGRLGIHVEYIEEHYARRFAAIQIDNIRLIDNFAL